MTALVTAAKSTQMTNLTLQSPTLLNPYESRGKLRYFFFDFTAASALSDGDIIELVKVPAGRLLPESKLYHSAMGASRTMDVGYQEHKPNNGTNATVDPDIDAFKDGVDVSSAGNFELDVNTQGYDLTGQAVLLAKIIGGTFPAAGTLHGHLKMVVE